MQHFVEASFDNSEGPLSGRLMILFVVFIAVALILDLILFVRRSGQNSQKISIFNKVVSFYMDYRRDRFWDNANHLIQCEFDKVEWNDLWKHFCNKN